MRRSRLLRSFSARITLLNAALVAAFSGSLIVFVALIGPRFMVENLDETVMDELHLMVDQFRRSGQAGLVALIQQRVHANADDHRVYLLIDAGGHRLVGNLDAWPRVSKDSAGWMVLPALNPRMQTRVRAHSLQLDNGSWLLVGFDEHRIDYMRKSIRQAAALGLVATLLFASIAGYLTSRVPLRQIQIINRTAERIIDGDLGQRVPRRGGLDELDRLGLTLNQMLDRIAELMQAVGSATDNIAHDLRTPLARLKTRIESAKTERGASGAQLELLDELSSEVDGVLSIFASLLRLATIQSGLLRSGFKPVPIAPLISDAVQIYEAVAGEPGIALSAGAPIDRRIDGDRDLLFQAICNLLDNAVKYSPDASPVTVAASGQDGLVRIAIDDEGPGIAAAERERVFERLVRLDASRSTPGSGLGLSLVRAIARLHGGECRIEPSARGTRVVLELPALGDRGDGAASF
ncbi:MAG: ATP-binding protein [Nevskia sp.]